MPTPLLCENMPHAAETKGHVTSCSETVLVLILMWDMRELLQKDVLVN